MSSYQVRRCHILLLLLTFSVTVVKTVKIESHKSLYQITPNDEEQLHKFQNLDTKHIPVTQLHMYNTITDRFAHDNYIWLFQLIIWSGIGDVGQPIQFLADPKDISEISNILDDIGVNATIEYPYVKMYVYSKTCNLHKYAYSTF
jgi:hypothetical protein